MVVHFSHMKKSLRILAMFLSLSVLSSYSAAAQGIGVSTGDAGAGISMDADDTASTKKKKKKKTKKAKKKDEKKKVSAVAKAASKLKTFNGKPSKKAKVFVYLQSASWCPPCNQEMPEVVSTYKEMKADGRAELILVGHDQTEDAAKGFLKKYRAKFPGVLASAPNVNTLPGFTLAQGIPNAIMVDSDGNVLASGYPSTVLSQWKQQVESLEAAPEAEEADAEAEAVPAEPAL